MHRRLLMIGLRNIERGSRQLIRNPNEVKPQCQLRVCHQCHERGRYRGAVDSVFDLALALLHQ